MGNSLEGFTGAVEPPNSNEPVKDKETERGSMAPVKKMSKAARFAVSSMQGWRATMEDTHILEPSLKISEELIDHGFFAVFDGHGGYFTSKYVSEHFSGILFKRKEFSKYLSLTPSARADVPGIQLLKDALTNSFIDMDKELEKIYVENLSQIDLTAMPRSRRSMRKQQLEDSRDESNSSEDQRKKKIYLDRSGTTVVSVLLTPTHIICSNAGDSRAILCRGGMTLPLSFDHKPANPTETTRVNQAGGVVRMKRIDGDLAVSRGFGDFRFKLNGNASNYEQKVISIPEIIVYPRDDEKDEFLVIGCDGIWDVLDNPTCGEIVRDKMKEGKTDLGQICEEMLEECFERQSKDNMTISIVTLPACKFGESSSRSLFSSLI
jgi:serine/threonine protein phosphatase PrpC